MLVVCQFFYNCGRSFAGNHCLCIEILSFSDKKKVLDVWTGIVGMQQAAAE